jgi:hypothetical protein
LRDGSFIVSATSTGGFLVSLRGGIMASEQVRNWR